MDQNQVASNDFVKRKRDISVFVSNKLIDEVKDKKITLLQLRPLAQEILFEVNKIKQDKDFIPVIEQISNRWNFLSGLLTKFKYENQSSNEKQVIEKLSKYIKNIN